MSLSKSDQNIGTIITFFAILLFLLYVNLMGIGMGSINHFLIGLGMCAVGALSLCFFVLWYLRKNNKPQEIDYLNIGLQRYILGLFMVFYGIPKLYGTFFDYQLFALDSKLIDVSDFELAWFYFGKNKWQELLSGLLEFFPGLLLFHRRTYYIASLILLPVTGQVFLLNLFFKIGGVTFPAAIILLACNAYIIYSQKENILQFFSNLDFSFKIDLPQKSLSLIKGGKVIALLLAVFVIFNRSKRALFMTDTQVKYQALVGKYSLQEMTKNNETYSPVNDSTVYNDLYIEKQNRWNIVRKNDNRLAAFVLDMNSENDSIGLYINRGGIGDGPKIIDSLTGIKGVYSLTDSILSIRGVQLGNSLSLKYKKQDLKPKEWFW